MKYNKFRLCFVIFFLLICNNYIFSQDYSDSVVVVKFRPGSQMAAQWQASGRSSLGDYENAILGRYTVRPYMRDAVLRTLDNWENNRYQKNNAYRRSDRFRNICIIHYNSGVSPLLVASKLRGRPDVEYAELLSAPRISHVPNDSLITRQYYLGQIKAYEAWDLIAPQTDVIVGIVDTGIDYNHEDLADNIWYNPGEMGTDNDGYDKSTNGIDDDNNGFVDDWQGMDFYGDGTDYDNNPMAGNPHGTHVAGLVAAVSDNIHGIAGVGRGVKLMNLKVGSNNPFSVNVYNSFEAILYAAAMGADIINCSWGDDNYSRAEEETIETITEMGSLLIAASGNDYLDQADFPGAYSKSFCVASVDVDDTKSPFSNWGRSVDISAPGSSIMSCMPLNNYGSMDGTSMATPIVSGAAALVLHNYPTLGPVELAERLKAGSDNLDTLMPVLIGYMGRGRLNILKALSDENLKSLLLTDYDVIDESGNGVLDRNERIDISVEFLNVLAPLNDCYLKVVSLSDKLDEFISDSIYIGHVDTKEAIAPAELFSFITSEDIPVDYEMELEIRAYDAGVYVNSAYISLLFRPSYKTMTANNIKATFNSVGNIAFNDYPTNLQGDGLIFKNSSNLLFEGSFMTGLSSTQIASVARSSFQGEKDRGFKSDEVFLVDKPGETAEEEGRADFYDWDLLNTYMNVSQHVYQFNEPGAEDIIIISYDLTNDSDYNLDSVFAALFFDWDIGPEGANNFAKFDVKSGAGFVRNRYDGTLPYVGVVLLDDYPINYYAIDNDGQSIYSPSIWDGFTKYEKWMTMSSGVARLESGIKDVSMVMGAGPLQMGPGEQKRVTFALLAADNFMDLRQRAWDARDYAYNYGIASGKYTPIPQVDSIAKIYPNPVEGNDFNIDIMLLNTCTVDIEIYDMLGRLVATPVKGLDIVAGRHVIPVTISTPVGRGMYTVRIVTNRQDMDGLIEIIR